MTVRPQTIRKKPRHQKQNPTEPQLVHMGPLSGGSIGQSRAGRQCKHPGVQGYCCAGQKDSARWTKQGSRRKTAGLRPASMQRF